MVFIVLHSRYQTASYTMSERMSWELVGKSLLSVIKAKHPPVGLILDSYPGNKSVKVQSPLIKEL